MFKLLDASPAPYEEPWANTHTAIARKTKDFFDICDIIIDLRVWNYYILQKIVS